LRPACADLGLPEAIQRSVIRPTQLIFECSIKEGSQPQLPENPDETQAVVRRVPLENLESVILYPNIRNHIIEYSRDRRTIEFIEDYQLKSYTRN